MNREPIFPTAGINEPWGSEFSFLTNGLAIGCRDSGELDTKRKVTICHRVHTLHWVVKLRFDPKHKIPFRVPRKDREIYKVLGHLYRTVLDMCVEAHAFSPTSYYNASEWFRYIFLEAAVEQPYILLDKKGRTEEAIESLQNANKVLRAADNPFCRYTEPHTFDLFEIAWPQVDSRTNIEFTKLWREFLQARAAWVKALASPQWRGLTQKNGELRMATSGRGRGTKPVRPRGK